MPTISDVARHAEVSPATVSRVGQEASSVHPATREKVSHAIEEPGCVPGAVAQSLRSKRTRSLVLVVSVSPMPCGRLLSVAWKTSPSGTIIRSCCAALTKP